MNRDVQELLSTLRRSDCAWVADEIEDSVKAGKSVQRHYREYGKRSSRTAAATAPYTDEEELDLCLRAIRAYFVDMPRIWAKTIAGFQHLGLGHQDRAVSIGVLDEQGAAVKLFAPDAPQLAEVLGGFLDKAVVPEGTH